MVAAPRPGFDYNHEVYLRAKAEAFARSGLVCQFCGQGPAEEAHHWQQIYDKEEETTANHLTALCVPCHALAGLLRRFVVRGGNRLDFDRIFRKALEA